MDRRHEDFKRNLVEEAKVFEVICQNSATDGFEHHPRLSVKTVVPVLEPAHDFETHLLLLLYFFSILRSVYLFQKPQILTKLVLLKWVW